MGDLGWGLTMAAVGMGLVFGLLALLWALLTLVLRFDRGEADAKAETTANEAAFDAEAAATTGASVRGGDALDAELLAAIVVATLTHKAARRREAAPVMRSYWPGSLLFASRWVVSGRVRQNRTWQRKGR